MKTFSFKSILVIGLVVLGLSSCTTMSKTMKEPNVRVDLNKSDFVLSEQVSAETSSTKIIGIDFSRLFLKKQGEVEVNSVSFVNIANIPVVGNLISDRTSSYALYELMQNNPGYDVVFYPQYEIKVVKPFLGIGFLTKTTYVKVTARLGKLKN